MFKVDETFYKEIKEVKYATNLVVSPDLEVRSYRYWIPQCRINNKMTLNDAVEGARQHLLESVRFRLRSDVPLAFCLSGGVDSASIVSIAANIFNHDVSVFSIIDRDERYNEYDNIRATIDHTNCKSTLIELSYDNALLRLRKLVEYHDMPVATISYFVHSLLSEQISKMGYRVAFSGTAADELFTGYYDHFLLHLNAVNESPQYDKYLRGWSENIQQYVRNPILRDPNLYRDTP